MLNLVTSYDTVAKTEKLTSLSTTTVNQLLQLGGCNVSLTQTDFPLL